MTLVRWDPVRELASMEVDRLNRMFADFYNQPFGRGWLPAVDVFESDNHEFVVKAELPDVKRADINVTFENGTLTLQGERRAEHEASQDRFHRIERQYGSFSRSFALPLDAMESIPSHRAAVRILQPFLRAAGHRRRVAHLRVIQRWCADGTHSAARGSEAEADRSRVTRGALAGAFPANCATSNFQYRRRSGVAAAFGDCGRCVVD